MKAPLSPQTHVRNLAARCARVLRLPPSRKRGCRECRVRAAPAISCAMCTEKCAHEHTGSAETLRHPPRNGFTAYAVLSSATNSSCHRHRRIKGCLSPVGPTRLRRFDTSNGCRNHTVLPYATHLHQEAPADIHIRRSIDDDAFTSFVCRARLAHGKPALRPIARPTLPRPPHPIPRS